MHEFWNNSGSDPTRLGRWRWVRLRGDSGQSTIVVSAYAPSKPAKNSGPTQAQNLRTVAKKHQSYFLSCGCKECVRKMFRVHLLEELKSWLDESKNVILCINANKNILHGIVARGLRAQGFRDAVRSHCDIDIGRTFKSRGTEQIGAIWVSA